MTKILLVDDSVSYLEKVSGELISSGFKVIKASNGDEGIQKCEQNSDIDLIICDLNMPIMDGLTMCTYLKENNIAQNAPIFVLTTETGEDEKKRGKEVGVKAWVTKPVDIQKLIGAINKILKL